MDKSIQEHITDERRGKEANLENFTSQEAVKKTKEDIFENSYQINFSMGRRSPANIWK